MSAPPCLLTISWTWRSRSTAGHSLRKTTRLKIFWQRLMKSMFQNFHPNLGKSSASTRTKMLSILLMDFVKNATTNLLNCRVDWRAVLTLQLSNELKNKDWKLLKSRGSCCN